MRFATGDDHNSPRRKDSWGMVQYVPWYNMVHAICRPWSSDHV